MENKLPQATLPRVEVTRPFAYIFTMQVCAVDDATDDEILSCCNRKNPSGTTNGWSKVIRNPSGRLGEGENTAPVSCDDHAGRTHFLVLC